ncbi:MAG: ATP-binding cassette domain-containing protein [Magnetococcus sp. DMHC-1]
MSGSFAIRCHLPRRHFCLDVALVIPAQGVVAITGPSGAGKTTLLHWMAGLEKGGQGLFGWQEHIWQDDARRINIPPHQRRIGLVFQRPRLFSHLSVQKNLLYGWQRTRPAERRIQLDAVVATLDLAMLLERRPETLSGGERQRVALGRALLASPRLLLMDEPLASLDTESKHRILTMLRHIQQQWSLPIFYVTHHREEVMQLAEWLVCMAAGQVTAEGPLQELIEKKQY